MFTVIETFVAVSLQLYLLLLFLSYISFHYILDMYKVIQSADIFVKTMKTHRTSIF